MAPQESIFPKFLMPPVIITATGIVGYTLAGKKS